MGHIGGKPHVKSNGSKVASLLPHYFCNLFSTLVVSTMNSGPSCNLFCFVGTRTLPTR
jgi:hypothetical protein